MKDPVSNLDDLVIDEDEIEREAPAPKKWLFVPLLFMNLLMVLAAVFGYAIWKDHNKPAVEGFSFKTKTSPPDYKDYNNQYWGIALRYPGTWARPLGSYDNDNFYFASEAISFIQELSPDEALVDVKGYNNYNRLPFEDWLTNQENNYFPRGTIIVKEPADLQGAPAKHYIIQPASPDHNRGYLDMLIVSRSEDTIYEFILATSDIKTHDKFLPQYENILGSIRFTPGFGLENNKK